MCCIPSVSRACAFLLSVLFYPILAPKPGITCVCMACVCACLDNGYCPLSEARECACLHNGYCSRSVARVCACLHNGYCSRSVARFVCACLHNGYCSRSVVRVCACLHNGYCSLSVWRVFTKCRKGRVGHNHTYIRMYGVYTVLLAGKVSCMQSHAVYIYSSGQP